MASKILDRESQRSPPESAGILLLSSHSQSVAEPVCLAGRGGKGFLQPVLPCAFEASCVEAWNLHQESPWCSEAPPPPSFVGGSHHLLGPSCFQHPSQSGPWPGIWSLSQPPALAGSCEPPPSLISVSVLFRIASWVSPEQQGWAGMCENFAKLAK